MTKEAIYGTCENIIGAEISNVCDVVLTKLDTLLELTNINDKEKKLKKLKNKVKQVEKYAKKLNQI